EDVSAVSVAAAADTANGKPAPVEAAVAREESPAPAAAPAAEAVPAARETGGESRVKASPLARRIARERGVDLAGPPGTGPEGRIIAEDVEQAAAGAGPASGARPLVPAEAADVVQLTSTRKTIARRLTEAWQAPVFQLGVSADMTEVLALREKLVERLG